MTTAARLLLAVFQLLRLIATFIDRAQLLAAERRGEDVGAVNAILALTETLDARLKAAADARLAAVLGSVPNAPDPDDRAQNSDPAGSGV